MGFGLKKDRIFGSRREAVKFPDLTSLQKESYAWFLREGLKELFEEISPIEDLTGRNLELHFVDYYFEEPKHDEAISREMDATFEASLRIKLRLVNKNTGEIKEQEVFLGDIPMMTKSGTFIINGVERVVVSQLVRSSGVLFTRTEGGQHNLYGVKIIPEHGAWLEIETSSRGTLNIKVDRKKKLLLTTLLRAFGFNSDEEIKGVFKDVSRPANDFIAATLTKDTAKTSEAGLIEFYKKMRPGDPATLENAKTLFTNMFQNFRRYDIGRVGRYKMNRRLMMELPNTKVNRILRREDLVAISREVVRLNNEGGEPDDVDDLKNRRVRAVGELTQQRFRTGLLRVERIVKDRMTTSEPESLTPAQLINARPISAIMQEFFGSFQLSQFMDQQNPLSELEHKRRLSATGPGGLHRERAGFEVRDVHPSHYSRICPIATPEGASVGLVGHLASFARINEYGFLEAPYHPVLQRVANDGRSPVGHLVHKDQVDSKSKAVLARAGTEIDERLARQLAKRPEIKEIAIRATVLKQIVYLDSYAEERAVIAQATIPLDEKGRILTDKVPVRMHGEPSIESIGRVSYVDVSPQQILSIGTSLIPFIEHDDAKRALMGTNMQRQAVPLIAPQPPIVGTGVEEQAAVSSGWVYTAPSDGKIRYVDGSRIEFAPTRGKPQTFYLASFARSNADTALHQTPLVMPGQAVKKGEVLCDGPAISRGKLALGQNLLVAFMSWEGSNFEDAIVVSNRLVKEDLLTSVHVKREEIDVRDTKLGPEITTRDIPNVGEDATANLSEDGIIRIGAVVRSGDILVGKITPKGETELTSEERLLRAIFGEKVKDVKDTSLRLPHGGYGKVIGIKTFDREKGDKLEVGTLKRIYVYVAQLRKISVGDKLAGRHGNKGVIAKILPAADMPHLSDGTPVDILLNPLGVVSRMNIGQILETHLGWAAAKLNYNAITPAFDGAKVQEIFEEVKKAELPLEGKVQLYDGRTGQPFEQKTTVGMIYMLKLVHMVDDKIHARSIGPYALVTQQPLGGKAQLGGQRLGEMEVWALEGYGAAHTLQEILTIKSDDVLGRARAYEAIIKGEAIQKPQTPEAFNVIVRELQGLGLSVQLLSKELLAKWERQQGR